MPVASSLRNPFRVSLATVPVGIVGGIKRRVIGERQSHFWIKEIDGAGSQSRSFTHASSCDLPLDAGGAVGWALLPVHLRIEMKGTGKSAHPTKLARYPVDFICLKIQAGLSQQTLVVHAMRIRTTFLRRVRTAFEWHLNTIR